jgi:peptidase M23-like protein/Big-like domain-containing protein
VSRLVSIVLALPPVLVLTACSPETVEPRALAPVSITVAPAQMTLPIGATAALVATVRDADDQILTDRTITWSSGAPEVASVSDAGVVQALDAGTATISAFSEPGLGLARVVVQEDIRLPLPGGRHWLLLTETGTPAAGCDQGEGGLRHTGDRDCSHGGVSRYSLDLAAVTQEDGVLPAVAARVVAAADGRVIDICLLPQAVTCGPNGPFIALEHRGGFRTFYAHLDPASIILRRKTPVARGQQVGTMAPSSTQPGPWVHFELRFENRGAEAAEVLERLLVDSRKLNDYRVATGESRFYLSSNGMGSSSSRTHQAPVRRRSSAVLNR